MAPLRERALTADETTSSTSGAVWTPPLRISKREHPSQISRRASNTINRLKSSSLVSQSPFRSEMPLSPPSRPTSVVPSPRRVSGEKRARPASMHAQAENEKPLGAKRRQSKGISGLAQRESVSKSPFLKQGATPQEAPSRAQQPPSRLPTPTQSVSPVRPSLVSRRLHGPRGLGSSGPALAKRERRKTVTFDPNCDVLEFERDSVEMEDEPFYSSDEDDYGSAELPYEAEGGTPVEGLVDSMLFDTRPHTPEHDPNDTHGRIPPGSGNEGNASHERTRATRQHNDQLITPPDTSSDNNYAPEHRLGHEAEVDMSLDDYREAPSPTPAPAKPRMKGIGMPPQREHNSDDVDPEVQVVELSFLSTSDVQSELDRHSEAGDISFSAFEAELGLTSAASTPPTTSASATQPLRPNGASRPRTSSFEGRKLPEPPKQAHSRSASPFDFPPPPPLNAGHAIRAGSPLGRERSPFGRDGSPFAREGSPFTGREGSPFTREGSPFVTREGSPAVREGSPFVRESSPAQLAYTRGSSPGVSTQPSSAQRPPLVQRMTSTDSFASGGSSIGSISSPRIRPEDVARKLARKNSPVVVMEESSSRQRDRLMEEEKRGQLMQGEDVEEDEAQELVFSRAELRRQDNYTHDGVRELDPVPTDIDPPRADIVSRAASDGNAYDMHDTVAAEDLDDGEHGEDLLVSNEVDDVQIIDQQEATRLRVQRAASFRGLQFDITTDGGLGLGLGLDDIDLGEAKSPLHKMVENVARPVMHRHVASVTEGISAQPASVHVSISDSEDNDDDEGEDEEGFFSSGAPTPPLKDQIASTSTAPQKRDAIKAREEAILQKRREARRNVEDEDMGRTTPPRRRPKPRRSASTGEIRDLAAMMRPAGPDRTDSDGRGRFGSPALEDFVPPTPDADLEGSIKRALKGRTVAPENSKYHVREHETIYAVRHTASAGDVAWRSVRRPSDMNEHAAQLRAYRALEKPERGHGKVFVRVVGIKDLQVPMPHEKTLVACTLNNGIHFVTTPECPLASNCTIDQEFELIEHSKLEFTLTMKVRRDPHILAQFKANASPPPALAPVPAPASVRTKPAPPPASKGGMRSFFSSSPKKASKAIPPPREPSPPPRPPAAHKVQENLARYLKQDGTLARTFVSFKELASRCDTRLFETSFPLIGQRLENGGKSSAAQVGELVLQFFRLPPLPGISPTELPQSLDECHRGLRHVQWHKMTYFEGVLTQNGGDCTTWRRRQFRVIGANLVAFNDVTKRAAATIDLRKAVRVEDPNTPLPGGRAMSPSLEDEYEFGVGIERSFRLAFRGGEEIAFYADSDEEKARWLEVLRALVGRIPPNPLWAELVWQRQQELGKAGPSK